MIKISINKDMYIEDYLIINNLLGQDGYDYNKASTDIINNINDFIDDRLEMDKKRGDLSLDTIEDFKTMFIDEKCEMMAIYYHDIYNLNHSININGNYSDLIDNTLNDIYFDGISYYKLLTYINSYVISELLLNLINIEEVEEGGQE